MRKLSCRTVIPRDCEWELVGQSDDEVLSRWAAHSASMHAHAPSDDETDRARGLIRGD